MSEAALEPHEPDAMGAWDDDGTTVWLPRRLYPTRIAAIRWAMREWDVALPEVRCRSRWMRYEPREVGAVRSGERVYAGCTPERRRRRREHTPTTDPQLAPRTLSTV